MFTFKSTTESICCVESKVLSLWDLPFWTTEECHLHLRDTTLQTLVDSMALTSHTGFYFQQDEAPPRFSSTLPEIRFLSARWIGPRGPSRSPDLTPLDSFQWSRLKSVLQGNRPLSIAAVQDNIRAACAVNTLATLRRARSSIHTSEQQHGHWYKHLLY